MSYNIIVGYRTLIGVRFDRYLVQSGVGSGTGFKPAIDFRTINAHQRVTIAGIVSTTDRITWATAHSRR